MRASDYVFGLYELARLTAISRFRLRGAYWRWRMETAFGAGLPDSRWELIRSAIAYGAWAHRIRRGL